MRKETPPLIDQVCLVEPMPLSSILLTAVLPRGRFSHLKKRCNMANRSSRSYEHGHRINKVIPASKHAPRKDIEKYQKGLHL